jgi:EAL domain-containing protein (putative c-di-GMP-specific phosphodiesterase class I)
MGPGGLLLVARDPAVIAATSEAALRMPLARPVQVVTGAEALQRLLAPGDPPRHLVLDAEEATDALLSAARDRFSGTEFVIVARRPGRATIQGMKTVPADSAPLAAALARVGAPLPTPDPAELAAGLARGEITVRFQPVVRLADRRPVLVEALARWERPHSAHPPADFVGVAEDAGLAMPLTLAVVARALCELRAALVGRHKLRLAFNVPLEALLHQDLPLRLGPIVAAAGFQPEDLLLELTESAVVRDTALLHRALSRLQRCGFHVVLDDLGMDDQRSELLELPFAGVKLDRSLIAALPRTRRARMQVERIAHAARQHGRAVIAEGISDQHLWRSAAAAGCDLAQGFGVSRPLLPSALQAWMASWAASALPRG